MRVIDLDRDMSDVIPPGCTLESEFLFRRMEEETFRALRPTRHARVLDMAAGVGQDGRALAARGLWTVGVEPSKRMTDLARLSAGESDAGTRVLWVRAWSESLPFPDQSFDAAFCKGALDHFDDPARCIAEAARVTRPEGRVVFSVANFESLGCRLARAGDRLPGLRPRRIPRRRRAYDVPSDHFTRYDPELLRCQLERHLVIESWIGVSCLWNLRAWGRLLRAAPGPVARALLALGDRVARVAPRWSDVIVAAGRPRI